MPAKRSAGTGNGSAGSKAGGSDAAAAALALARADVLLAALAGRFTATQLEQARALLTTLRNQRAHPVLRTLAEAVVRIDASDAASRCLYAQALIETGAVVPALALLDDLARTLPKDHPLWAEALGLAGRCHKQIFFDAMRSGGPRHPAARRALASAVAAYARPYRADRRRHTWHGVNLLALAARAQREGWAEDIAPAIDVARLARQLLNDLRALPAAQRAADPWHLPTLAEVALGLTLATGEVQAVETVLAEYLNMPGLSAFQVQSTLRQFTEVWGLEQLSVRTPGVVLASPADAARLRRLVDMLRARLMQLPGGEVRVVPATLVKPRRGGAGQPAVQAAAGDAAGVGTAAAVAATAPAPSTDTPAVRPAVDPALTSVVASAVPPAVPSAAISAIKPAVASAVGPAITPAERGQLEAVLGVDGPQTFAWWRAGVEAARSVAVVRQRLGRRLGTGFLVRAGDLGLAAQPDELLLLTNFHVVNPDGSAPGIRPADAEVVFEADNPGQAYAVGALLWSSPVAQHDAALLRLQAVPAGVRALPLAAGLPELPPPDEKKRPRVYVIGYPGGRELSFAFQDNELIDHEGPPAGKPQIDQVCRVHYRAPTEGGSSGSPVFEDRQWQVIALHHMGGKFGMPRLNGVAGTYAANEGLAISTLAAAVKAAHSAQGAQASQPTQAAQTTPGAQATQPALGAST